MTPTHKNIINKWLKLYFYIYNPSYLLQQQDEVFCKNIPLYFKSSNEFIQINLVQKYGWVIKYIIKNGILPSEKVQLAAVNQDGHVISLFENPSEKVQLAAVDNYVYNINYIKNPHLSVIELYEKLSGKKYEKQ